MTPAAQSRKPFRLWRRLLRFVFLVAAGLALVLTGCQHRLIYFPRAYSGGEPESFVQNGGQRLDFTTAGGRQSAWLLPPRAPSAEGGKLWIVCSGNAAVGLDAEPWCRSLPPPFTADAFLFIDYPGYGACEGSASPRSIRESLRAAIPLAARQLGIPADQLPQRAIVFGNSLGSAAALMAAEEFHLRRAVLCAPFTSTMEMAAVMLKLPLGFLVHHRFDNRSTIAALQARGGRAIVIHGAEDRVIPPDMGQSLAAAHADAVEFVEVPRAGHNDLFARGHQQIVAALSAMRAAVQ